MASRLRSTCGSSIEGLQGLCTSRLGQRCGRLCPHHGNLQAHEASYDEALHLAERMVPNIEHDESSSSSSSSHIAQSDWDIGQTRMAVADGEG